MQQTKYEIKCTDCDCVWHIYTDGKTTTGTNVNDLLEAHELNCTPEIQKGRSSF